MRERGHLGHSRRVVGGFPHPRAAADDGPYSSPESEFWYNVRAQSDMPIAGSIQSDFRAVDVAAFIKAVSGPADAGLRDRVARNLLVGPHLFHDLRQLLGVPDKRAYLELSYLASRIPHPSAPTGICGCQPWNMARHPLDFFVGLLAQTSPAEVRRSAAEAMTDYLLREGLAEAAQWLSDLTSGQLAAIYRSLVMPRETQQKAAKRRGHGCEGELARVLYACGVEVLPENKHTNPMGAKDPNLDKRTLGVARKKTGETFSFDMIVLDHGDPRVAIQCLIHTSDPGQYGVNKSNETVEVASHFRKANRTRPKGKSIELWGLVDGAGFSENKPDTINKMLYQFDCFVQLNTLYKAPLRLHVLGLCEVKAVRFLGEYTPQDIEAISDKYVPEGVIVLSEQDAANRTWVEVAAGRAVVYLQRQ